MGGGRGQRGAGAGRWGGAPGVQRERGLGEMGLVETRAWWLRGRWLRGGARGRGGAECGSGVRERSWIEDRGE